MSGVSVRITGFENIDTKLTKIYKDITDATLDQLHEVAVEIMSNSQEEVPKDTTALVRSGFITEEGDSIIFGYGGPNTKVNPKTGIPTEEYALKVHEDLYMNHPRGGKAKFLEDPFNDACNNLDVLLINPLKSIFK
jgi:hypothetical protein